MKAYMFKSRTGALAFVAMTLIGAATMVGSETEGGTIDAAKAELERQRQLASDQAKTLSQAEQNPEPIIVQVDAPLPAASETKSADLGFEPLGLDPKPMLPEPMITPEGLQSAPAGEAGAGTALTAPAPETIIR